MTTEHHKASFDPLADYQYLTEENYDGVVDLFLRQINYTETCWLWTGTVAVNGYGVMNIRNGKRANKKQGKVHRLSWEIANERRVPVGLTIDHTCVVSLCVNPAHLEPVTSRVNLLRRWERFRANRPSHCFNGHEYTPETSKIAKRGTLVCRLCERAADKRHRERKAAA